MSSEFDPRQRELCTDGACIGLIGPDGVCKECGKPGRNVTQHPRHRGMVAHEVDGDEGDREDDRIDEEEDDDREDDRIDEQSSDEIAAFDEDERQLCPDGACIGVIGPDGRCRECGAMGDGGLDPRIRGMRSEEDIAAELEANITKGDATPPPEDFERRALCPDGGCIGVIGPDGRCGECGASAADAADDS